MRKGNKVTPLGDNRFLVETRPNDKIPHDRKITIEPGNHYVIIPTNRNALKNRNRECVYLSPRDSGGYVVKIKFIDTGRVTHVDIDDLTDITERARIEDSLKLLQEKQAINVEKYSGQFGYTSSK